jgi:N-acetylglutamate synthase-like GNAT family acetyltransferase
METTIRKYNKHDRNECLAAFKSNVPLYFTEAEVIDFENFLTRTETLNNDDKDEVTHYYVILFEQKIIGCGGFGDKDNNKIISLAWGLIHKDYHKKQFGKQLLLYRLKQIKQLYINLPVVIDTTQFSFQFFEKFGFVTTKITEDYYTKGMHRYDMILKDT